MSVPGLSELHELAARNEKIARLAVLLWVQQVPPHLVASFTPEQWRLVARHAGTTAPSTATIDKLLHWIQHLPKPPSDHDQEEAEQAEATAAATDQDSD